MPSPQASVRLSRSTVRLGAASAAGGGHGRLLRARGCRVPASVGSGPGRRGRARRPPGSAARRRWKGAAPPRRQGAPAPAHGRRAGRGPDPRRGTRPAPAVRRRAREGGGPRERALEHAHPLGERLHSRVEVGPHGAHDGDLEHHLRVGGLAHVDQGVAQDLHAAHHPGRPIVSASAAKRSSDGPDTAHSSGASAARKTWRRSSISSVASCWGPQPPANSALRATSTWPTSPSASGIEHLGQLGPGGVGGARRHDLVQGRERVAGRAPTAAHRRLERHLVELEAGLGVDRLEQVVQRLRAEEPELQVLRPAADGRRHLLRVRRGEHEDDVARRLLERLQQARWPPPSRACGPRRRCRPSSARGCPARRGPPGRAWRPHRCSMPHRARAR